MKKIVLAVLALFFLWQAAPAQAAPAQDAPAQAVSAQAASFDKARLDAYFDALEDADRFWGSVALSRNGEVIYRRSVGYSDYENGKKASESSEYRIGSISKTFTSVLVMKAFEQGKLAPNQTIDAFFPSVPMPRSPSGTCCPSERHYTTRSLLIWNNEPRTESQMVALIANVGDFEPGSDVRYSNSNLSC